MAQIGHGYGSEWHLLRWMGRHRKAFDQNIRAALGRKDDPIEWEDFRFRKGDWPDEELEGLAFLENADLQSKWADFWPQTGRAQTWDAVGWITSGARRDLLLIEAKAHLSELASNCNAAPHGGRPKIEAAFAPTKAALGVPLESNWMVGYYQYANRVTALNFLNGTGVSAHIVLIYFVGDKSGASRDCPSGKDGWAGALRAQDIHIGLPPTHILKDRIHSVFLNVGSEN